MPECICLGLRRAARQFTRFYDERLAKLGLASQQVTILAVIELNRAISISDLATFLGMDRTTLTRNLRPLFTLGLVKRLPDDDRRKKLIALSARGSEQLAQALPFWHSAQKEALAAIGASDWKKISARLGNALGQLEDTQLKHPQT